MKLSGLILLIHLGSSLTAQQNKIKLGFIGFPTVSGFGIGDIGYERFNDQLTACWQFHFSASGGAIATDVGTETRKWVTIEKTFYRKTISKRITWSYSFFTETGSRDKSPGKVLNTPEKILIKTKWFEINPGASLGIQFRLGRKFGIETQLGPKLIFANGKEYYRNSVTDQKFTETNNNNRVGYRLTGGFTYQF